MFKIFTIIIFQCLTHPSTPSKTRSSSSLPRRTTGYAKIIACSAYSCANGGDAKKKYYGFIKSTFKKLQSGEIKWSDILREDKQMLEEEKKSSNLPTGNPEAGTCSDLGDYDKAIISSDEVETKKL